MRNAIRRELMLWSNWRPWFALLGGVCMTGTVLGEKILGLSSYLSSVQLGMGLREPDSADFLFLAALVFAFCMWSWIAGFVLGSLSGRTVWLTGPLLYFAVNNSYLLIVTSIRWGSPHVPPLPQFILDLFFPRVAETFLVFLLPALWGMVKGYRRPVFEFRWALMMALATTFLTLLVTWMSATYEVSNGAWRTPLPSSIWQVAMLLWPIPYILATAGRQKIATLL